MQRIAEGEEVVVEVKRPPPASPIELRGTVGVVLERIVTLIVSSEERALRFGVDQELRIQIVRRDGLYVFTTQPVREFQGSELIVPRPDQLSRLQRRQSVRLDVGVPFVFSMMVVPFRFKVVNYERGPGGQALTTDLSAGGLRFRSTDKLVENTLIKIQLDLDENEKASAVGKVLRVSGHEDGTFEMGVQFVKLGQTDEARIVRFIQRSQLKARESK